MSKYEDSFHLKEVNHQELLQVLLSYFGHAEGIKPKVYRYKKKGIAFPLDVLLDTAGNIEKIELSSGFPNNKLNKIENKIKEILIDNQGQGFGQTVGFSSERVNGFFRYKDLFEIIPAPDIAPKPKVSLADHPFLLQFSYTSCPNLGIDYARRLERSSVYFRLLNLFSNRRVFLPSQSVRFSWIIEEKNTNSWVSKWRQEGYTYKGFSEKIDNYTSIENFPSIKRVPFHEYYSSPLVVTSKSLKFPDNLEKSFDLAFRLNEQDWKRFFMACSWYYQAMNIWLESNSSSFIALVTAIECLTDKPNRCRKCNQTTTEGLEKCEQCGQPRYRVTKKFKDCLEKYVPFLEERFPKERKLLYEVRSKLSHGMDLLTRDLKPWCFIMSKRAEEQGALQRNLHFITRTAIYNWLWNTDEYS